MPDNIRMRQINRKERKEHKEKIWERIVILKRRDGIFERNEDEDEDEDEDDCVGGSSVNLLASVARPGPPTAVHRGRVRAANSLPWRS